MHRPTSRDGRWLLALTLFGLGACADEPAAPRIPSLSRPNASVGDVITVTNTSGGNGQGSLRWAVAQTTGGEVIRFAPEIAGTTIVVDTTILIEHGITIEGPRDKGITISGGFTHHIFAIAFSVPTATTFRNLALVNGTGNGSAGGGGISSGTTADVVVENVTISNHVANNNAALYTPGNATLINTTISENESGDHAAVWAGKRLTLINSTVARNSKGGISAGQAVTLRNSIVADNGTGPNCEAIYPFAREYYGRNLSDDTTCGDSTALLVVTDAKLDSLRYNGGPAKTHALDRSSPALNAGTECTVTADERNVQRDATCDLGAFEFTDYTTATVTTDGTASVNPSNGWVMITGSLKCSRDETFDLAVEVKQELKSGRVPAVVQATGKLTVNCTTTTQPWGIALAPATGAFSNGSAVVAARIDAAPWVKSSPSSVPVKLFWGHK